MTDSITQAARLLKKAKKVIAFTGAGVSTESGIPDFRSKGGLWSRFDPMEYGTIGAFRRNPAKVWKMLVELIDIARAKPNAGHLALAEMEKAGVLQGIITQNIDLLHQKAGSRNVVEFHGSIESFTCLDCGRGSSLASVRQGQIPPVCPDCHSLLKPDVVFFDEQIPIQALAQSEELLAGADVLIVAGTSCQVPPASFIPAQLHGQGGKIIEVNLEPVLGGFAEVVLQGTFTKMMTELVGQIERSSSGKL